MVRSHLLGNAGLSSRTPPVLRSINNVVSPSLARQKRSNAPKPDACFLFDASKSSTRDLSSRATTYNDDDNEEMTRAPRGRYSMDQDSWCNRVQPIIFTSEEFNYELSEVSGSFALCFVESRPDRDLTTFVEQAQHVPRSRKHHHERPLLCVRIRHDHRRLSS